MTNLEKAFKAAREYDAANGLTDQVIDELIAEFKVRQSQVPLLKQAIELGESALFVMARPVSAATYTVYKALLPDIMMDFDSSSQTITAVGRSLASFGGNLDLG